MTRLFSAIVTLWILGGAAFLTPVAAASLPPRPPAATTTAINTALQANQADRAHTLLESALRKYPSWKQGWWQLGSLAYDNNDYLGGRLAFGRLTQLDPHAGAPWVMLGLCDFELRDFGLSLLHIEQGRAFGFPKNPDMSDVARYHQALDLIVMEHYAQAGYLLDSFGREGHRSRDIILAEGLAAMHIPAIGPTFQRVVSPARYHLVRQVGEAQYLSAARKFIAARKVEEALLKQYPDTPWLHYAVGVLMARWGELKRSNQLFRAELKINPENVPALLQIAANDLKLDQPAAGLPSTRRAVQLEPNSFAAHFLLGQILVMQGQLQAGTHELEISRDLEPNSSQIRYALAQAYLRLHRRKDALREERAFQRLRPIENSMMQKGTLPASVFEPAAAAAVAPQAGQPHP